MTRQQRAFTLVELLTVIAVIAVLAGLLFPVFARARNAANDAKCLSNLRQLGLGVENYRLDWDDRFPFAIDFWDRNLEEMWRPWDYYIPNASANVALLSNRPAADGSPFGGQIDRVMRAYTVSENIWRCPSDMGVAGMGAATSTGYEKDLERRPVWSLSRGNGTWGGTSYVYRTELGLRAKPAARLRMPALTNVLFDAAHYWHGVTRRPPRDKELDFNDKALGRYNILYADGHVKSATWQQYYDAWYTPYYNAFGGYTGSPFL